MSLTLGRVALAAALLIALPVGPAVTQQIDKVTFGTNWKAQAEHGGYYQAVADGTYAKYGLDVTVRQGGPQVNHSQLLAPARSTSTWAATCSASSTTPRPTCRW